MRNGKHERSWKVSLVPPYTWKQALIKTNYILKNCKEGERGNLTDLCQAKKAEMKAEQREETILHPKDSIQALPMIYLQFPTAVWSGINSPGHLPAVPEQGEAAGHPARTELSFGKGITAGAQLQAEHRGQGSSEQILQHQDTSQPHPAATQAPLGLVFVLLGKSCGVQGFALGGGSREAGFLFVLLFLCIALCTYTQT